MNGVIDIYNIAIKHWQAGKNKNGLAEAFKIQAMTAFPGKSNNARVTQVTCKFEIPPFRSAISAQNTHLEWFRGKILSQANAGEYTSDRKALALLLFHT